MANPLMQIDPLLSTQESEVSSFITNSVDFRLPHQLRFKLEFHAPMTSSAADMYIHTTCGAQACTYAHC